jgi:thiamine pyrophosphate-dependent acetolactate synthase large subunit-like protein
MEVAVPGSNDERESSSHRRRWRGGISNGDHSRGAVPGRSKSKGLSRTVADLGPGATNLLTGVADANFDKAPLVAITGQGELDRLHHESHQRIDVVRMFESVTKWNSAVYTPEIVPEVVRKAFKLAELEKPGATHIELGEDVAHQQISKDRRPMEPGVPSVDRDRTNKLRHLTYSARMAF